MTFLPVECAVEKQSGNNGLIEMEAFLYDYSSSAVVNVREWIPVTSFADVR